MDYTESLRDLTIKIILKSHRTNKKEKYQEIIENLDEAIVLLERIEKGEDELHIDPVKILKIIDASDLRTIVFPNIFFERTKGYGFTDCIFCRSELTMSICCDGYSCRRCDSRGNTIAYVMKLKNLSHTEASKFLIEKFDIENV